MFLKFLNFVRKKSTLDMKKLSTLFFRLASKLSMNAKKDFYTFFLEFISNF